MMSVAATSQKVPGLAVTAPDDDMELGSDFGRNEDDIDIDIDIGGEDQDEDSVLEDARSDYGMEAQRHDNDDIMFDDDIEPAEENTMQDNITENDEHLTDASELGQNDNAFTSFHQSTTENPVTTVDDDIIDYEDEEEVPEHQIQNAILEFEDTGAVDEQPPEVTAGGSLQEEANGSFEIATPEVASPQASAPEKSQSPPLQETETDATVLTEVEQPFSPGHTATESASNEQEEDEVPVQTTKDKSPEQQLESPSAQIIDADNVDHTQISHDDTANLTHADLDHLQEFANYTNSTHPITLYWGNNTMSLFPTQSDTFFLQEESLANQSLEVLFRACRKQLGHDISEEDELVMDFYDIGLIITEVCRSLPCHQSSTTNSPQDSTHCTNSKLSDILDVYTLLHQQDGTSIPGPLNLTLDTQTRFSFRLNQLTEAACDGKGFSQLTFLKSAEDNDSEHYANNFTGEGGYEEESNHLDEPLEDQYQDNSAGDPEVQANTRHDENDFLHDEDNYLEVELNNDQQDESSAPEGSSQDRDTENNKTDETNGGNTAIVGLEHHLEPDEYNPHDEVSENTPQNHDENDLIDYDDDEGPEHPQDREAAGLDRSSESSTIRDDTTGSSQHTADPDPPGQNDAVEHNRNDLEDANVTEEAGDVQARENQDYDYQDFAAETFHTEDSQQEYTEESGHEVDSFAALEYHHDSNHQEDQGSYEAFDQQDTLHEHGQEEYSFQGQEGDEHSHEYPEEYPQDDKDLQQPHGDDTEDFADADHGDFDYPEFVGDISKSGPDSDLINDLDTTQTNDDHESDIIDFDDDEVENSPKPASYESSTEIKHSSTSPRVKRARDEHDDEAEESDSPKGMWPAAFKRKAG